MILPSSRPTADVAEQQWATLSFVPEDLAWFDWIIRQIEGYPVPAELAGAPTRFGFDLPAKLTLFPDRWNPLNFETYDSALETSRFLVVVVSPNSAESSWVEDQMAAFRGCGGDERIVALVVDGRPDGEGGNGTTDWLPQWLVPRLGENGFAPADSSEPVVIDARGAGEKLERARESLLASLLTTTCQELERMGGLAPPLDLLPQIAQPAAPAPKPEAQPATRVPPRYSWKMTSITVCAALLLFGSGWFLGRATAPTPGPAAVDVSHKRRPNVPASAAATITTPAVTAPSVPQIADATKTDDPASVPDAAPVANPAKIVALPSPVPESAVEAPASAITSAPTVAAAPKPDSTALPNADSSPAQSAAETVALPLLAPGRPVPVQAPSQPTPAIGLTSEPVASTSPNPGGSSQLAGFPTLPTIVPERNVPAEQIGREQIERERRRHDDEALRAQWLSQVAAADTAFRKGKMMQATDFYNAAMATAERYAARRSDDVSALTEMARQCQKLAAMQLQTASVGEARATFERGRRFLALLKSRGPLTPAHAQILQELETGLQTLPRD